MKIYMTGFLTTGSLLDVTSLKDLPITPVTPESIAEDMMNRGYEEIESEDLDNLIANVTDENIRVKIYKHVLDRMVEAIRKCDESIITSIRFEECYDCGYGYDYYIDFELDNKIIKEVL